MKSQNKRQTSISKHCFLPVSYSRFSHWGETDYPLILTSNSIFVTVKEEKIVQPANRTFFVCLFDIFLITTQENVNMVKNPLVYHIIDIKTAVSSTYDIIAELVFAHGFSIYHNCPWLLSYLILLLFVFDFKITNSSCLSFQFQGEFLSFFIQSLFHFSV